MRHFFLIRSPPGKPLISYCKMMFALRNHNEEVVPCVPNKKMKCFRKYKPPFRPIFPFYEPANVVVRNNSKNYIRVHNTAIIFSNSFITNHWIHWNQIKLKNVCKYTGVCINMQHVCSKYIWPTECYSFHWANTVTWPAREIADTVYIAQCNNLPSIQLLFEFTRCELHAPQCILFDFIIL